MPLKIYFSLLRKVCKMRNNINFSEELDDCFYKLEQLSSKIADSISIGNFGEVTKLDLARKVILQKISKDTANLNERNRKKLKLIWVNNCKLIEDTQSSITKKQEDFNRLRKTFKAYSQNN